MKNANEFEMEEEIKEIDFISFCHIEHCKNKDKLYRWLHSNCGGRQKLTREGMVRCLKCAERGKFVYWPFNCGEHDYERLSDQKLEHFLFYITRLGVNDFNNNQLGVSKSKENFLEELTRAIMTQYIEIKEKERSGTTGNNVDGGKSKQKITEIDFIAPCPVQDCIDKNKCYKWIHTKCKGRLKLNDKGMLRCINCGTQEPFVNWPFNCGDHEDKECSARGFAHAFGIIPQLADGDEKKQLFIKEVTIIVMKQILEQQKERKIVDGGCMISEECSNFYNKSEQKSFQEQSNHKSNEEVLELDLISPCPVQECVTKDTLYKWTHNKCGGQLKLNIKGMIRCHECGTQVKYVDWPFNCGAHNGKKTCSLVGATHALEVASQLEANKNYKELIKKALQVIINDTFDDIKIEAIGKKI